MGSRLYSAVFEGRQGHVAYGAARLSALPDLFGDGPKLTASLEEKLAWLEEALRPHDDFVRLLLRFRGLRACSLRVRVSPAESKPVEVAYLLRAVGKTEERAEAALDEAWAQFRAAYPSSYFLLEPIECREEFDRVFDLDEELPVFQIAKPTLRFSLTPQRHADCVPAFTSAPLRWNDLLKLAMGMGQPLVVDLSLVPAVVFESEVQWLTAQLNVCRAVSRVTGADLAQSLATALEWNLAELAQGVALVRVGIAAPASSVQGLSHALKAAFCCRIHPRAAVVEPDAVCPQDVEAQQGLFHGMAFLLAPAALMEKDARATRWPWLCSASAAAYVFRPPVLIPPEHARVRFAVPPALEDSLAKSKVINVHRGLYIEKGASVASGQIHVDLHDEHIGGDKIGGDQIIAGDKTTSVQGMAGAPPHDAAGTFVAGDSVRGDQVVAGDRSVMASDGIAAARPAPGATSNEPGQRCSECGQPVLPQAKFCMHCGAALPKRCPGCGGTVGAADRFCTECGASLAPPPRSA